MAEWAVERVEGREDDTALGRTVRVLEQKPWHKASIAAAAPRDIRATPSARKSRGLNRER